MRTVIDHAGWQAARTALLVQEKALTAEMDRVAAMRRRMPWEQVTASYGFVGPKGEMSLGDLFEGRTQLIVYHHMLRPADPAPCSGCGLVGDQIPHLAHLHARDTSMTFVSFAPHAEIAAFRARMGWQVPWVETGEAFNLDMTGERRGTALNVFIRRDGGIFRTYFTTGRGLESFSVWSLLDMTPYGRQETWQDAPEDVPQSDPYAWWKLHDEYGAAETGAGRA